MATVPRLTWRDLRKNEHVIHVFNKPDGHGRQEFSMQWRTDYIVGQPHSPRFHLVRGQLFCAVLDNHVNRLKARKNKVRIINLYK